MKRLKQYFGEFHMTWPRVLGLAVLTAVYTAVVKLLPFLDNTSLQDIAIYPDCWFLFAIFIIVNCKTWQEASLKCFVFFLLSQPLIYLIQVPFYDYGWQIFQYYPRWLLITFLTLPGAAIAFLLRRKDWFSVAVLSVATGYLAVASISYFKSTVTNFPYHLLSAVICLVLAVFFVFVLLDQKKHRIAALAVLAAIFITAAAFYTEGRSQELILDEGSWSCSVEDNSIVEVVVNDGNRVKITAKHNGNTEIRFQNADGSACSYYVTVSGGSLWVSPFDDGNEVE